KDSEYLAKDYEFARSRSIEGILRPLAYLEHEGAVALVIEDDGAVPIGELFLVERLGLDSILEIGCAVALILERLHSSGTVHNNINPYSVWVDRRSLSVKITDFSLSEPVSQLGSDRDRKPPVSSDVRYLSPEQTGRTSQVVDTRSDIYALGILLHHGLAGAPPFGGPDPLAIMHANLTQAPVPLAR